MAKTTSIAKKEWDTLHNNGPFPLKLLYVTKLEEEANISSKIGRYNDVAREIRRLVQETQDAGEGFRAYGSRWSLSNIAHHKDRMHNNSFMNIHLPLAEEDFHAETAYDRSNLFFFECGNTIKEISRTLDSFGKSLKTCGASNGQTIAGCISTGVHGSCIDVGSVQDYVVGINLITGPNADSVVYLERHTKPALSDSFGQKINSRIIRDDDLFNAALVGLGGFGFIHGVVVEAEDRFLLKRYVQKMKTELALELAKTMDFEGSGFRIEGETDSQGRGVRPYHYDIYFNPYNKEDHCVVEIMYKKPYAVPYPDPLPVIKNSVYKDIIYLFITISEKFPKSIPWFINRMKRVILPEVDEITTGTLAEIFWDAPYQGPAYTCSFGVDHRDSSRALNALTELVQKEGPIPGIFSLRFVKRSEATLAFSKFPITCMLEIAGVLWKKSRKLMSLTEFSRRMIEVLKENGIPFTIHWGKNSDWAFPDLVKHMHGHNVEKWLESRNTLLSPEMAQLFSNDFLKTIGLSSAVKKVEETRVHAIV